MATRASEIMSKDVSVIREDETIRAAAERLAAEDVGVLPITDEQRQIKGMLTDRDIVVRVVAQGKDANTTRARELEQGEVITLRPEDSIEHVVDLMAEHQVRRLPVVQNGLLVGMVSQADVVKAVDPQKAGRMVTSISKA